MTTLGIIYSRRAWQPTPVFLPGESHGQRSLAGYSPRGHKELDTTDATYHTHTHSHHVSQIRHQVALLLFYTRGNRGSERSSDLLKDTKLPRSTAAGFQFRHMAGGFPSQQGGREASQAKPGSCSVPGPGQVPCHGPAHLERGPSGLFKDLLTRGLPWWSRG